MIPPADLAERPILAILDCPRKIRTCGSGKIECLEDHSVRLKKEVEAKDKHSVDYSQQTGYWHVSKLFPMLGNELRKARERAKKTQEQLAFDADVDRTYISMLENDKKSPTVEMLFRLCESMDVAINIVTLQLLPQAAYRTWLG